MAEREGDYDVVLLGSGSAGYGDARNRRRDSYPWAINFDLRSGRSVPAAAYARVLAQTTFGKVAALFEWENAAGDPILIWTGCDASGNATIFEWINATLTTEDQNIPAYTSAVLYRYDQDATIDPDEEMAFFCNGFTKNNIVRRKKDGTVDTGATTSHTAKADLLAVIDADLYRVSDGYKLGKLTNRTDPGIDGNYPPVQAAVPVGRPTYAITNVLPLGGSPIAFSGQGVAKYNPAPSSPVFASLLGIGPDPDHGVAGFADARGRLFFDSEDGHIIVITFGFQQTHTPGKHRFVDRNTPYGRLSASAVDLENVYLALEPGFLKTQTGVGLVVKLNDGGSITTHTSSVTNRTWNSEASVALLTTGDFILVGTDEPNMGTYMELAGMRDSETPASAMTISYSTGTSSWATATIMDSTLAFVQSGLISFHNSFQHPFDLTSTPWAKGTVDGVSKYWIRIEPQSTLTGVTIREVHVLPYRPPIDPDKNQTTDVTRMTGYKQAGALPTILSGTWKGEELILHDVWTLWTSKIEKMVTARVNDGVTSSRRALYAVTGDGLYAMPIGPDGDPARAVWPNLGDADTLAAGLNDHVVPSMMHDFGLPAFAKTVNEVVVEGNFLQADDDELWLYSKMEHDSEYKRHGPFAQFPATIKGLGTGRALQVIAAYKDGSRDANAPQIESIIVPKGKWTYEDAELVDAVEEPTESPQAS